MKPAIEGREQMKQKLSVFTERKVLRLAKRKAVEEDRRQELFEENWWLAQDNG